MWFWHPKVLIYADFIDPFCYIGFHNLRRAAEAAGVVIDWRGFELNPDTPPEGYDLQTAPNSDLRPGMWASVRDFAERSGLRFPEPRRAPNTRAAHRLVEMTPKSDVKNPLIERIYQAYFIGQEDIGNMQVLIGLAKEFGVSEENVLRGLEEAPLGADPERHREEAMKRNFPGMPGFLFKGKTYFGALSENHWKEILKPYGHS